MSTALAQSIDSNRSANGGSYWHFCANTRVRVKDWYVHPLAYRYWPGCISVDAMSRAQLSELQQQRLRALVADVIEHVPFYCQWAKANGFHAGRLPELQDLPIVTKQDYRQDVEAFQSARFPVKEMGNARTSGSSGEPFRFRLHRQSADYNYCCLWRSLRRYGLRPGHRRVYIWGRSYRFNATASEIRRVRYRHMVRDWMNNSLSLNAYELTHQNVDAAIASIERFRPAYLHGYVTAIYTIARRLLDGGRSLASLGLRAVITEAEKLYDTQRQAMHEAFACPILEHYGCVEVGNIAQTDLAGRLRVNDDAYILERLPTGDALVTGLFTHAYPFIRYRIGDLVELAEPPADDLPYLALTQVIGRTVDLIPLVSGGHVHGVALAHTIDPHLNLVLKYQIRQLALDHFCVRLITNAPLPDAVADRIAADIRQLVGQSCRIDVERVDDLPPAESGKFRWVISDLTAPTQPEPGQAPANQR